MYASSILHWMKCTDSKIYWFNQRGFSSSLIRVSPEVGSPGLVHRLHKDALRSFYSVILGSSMDTRQLQSQLTLHSRQEKEGNAKGQGCKVGGLLFPLEDFSESSIYLYYVTRAMALFCLFSFWLHWVFIAMHGLSLVAASRLSSCGSRALQHRLSSCGARA